MDFFAWHLVVDAVLVTGVVGWIVLTEGLFVLFAGKAIVGFSLVVLS